MKRAWIILLVLISLIGLTAAARAQIGAGYDLSWWTIDSGGGMNLTGSGYSHAATVGQPDASTASGSGYTFTGGFWGIGIESTLTSFEIYLPVLQR